MIALHADDPVGQRSGVQRRPGLQLGAMLILIFSRIVRLLLARIARRVARVRGMRPLAAGLAGVVACRTTLRALAKR